MSPRGHLPLPPPPRGEECETPPLGHGSACLRGPAGYGLFPSATPPGPPLPPCSRLRTVVSGTVLALHEPRGKEGRPRMQPGGPGRAGEDAECCSPQRQVTLADPQPAGKERGGTWRKAGGPARPRVQAGSPGPFQTPIPVMPTGCAERRLWPCFRGHRSSYPFPQGPQSQPRPRLTV